jgi:hypothetical protein
MSCYEWSSGTIVLPSNQYASFRKQIENVERQRVQTIFDATQKFWSGLGSVAKRSMETYFDRLQDDNNSGKFPEEYGPDIYWTLANKAKPKPRRVLKADLQWPTNRTEYFADGEFSLTFDSSTRSVRYNVSENNHARDWAEKTPLHRAFVSAIASVRWTRSSGGVILGNDEYHREAGYDNEGGGGSYVVSAYGYVGAKEAPQNTLPFINSEGQQVKVETHFVRGGRIVGKVVPDSGRMFSGRW